MARLLFVFIVCLSLTGCKNNQKSSAEQVLPEAAPPKWLEFDGVDDSAPHIVLVSGDEEYRSEEALPQLAKILSEHHGFKCTVLFAQDTVNPGVIDPNFVGNIYGLEALNSSDLMILFTRFRALPDNQMHFIDTYLKAGKPVVGIRTATHAFNFGQDTASAYSHYSFNYEGGKLAWKEGFGRLVLGETWINHHGQHKHQSTLGIIADGAEEHPITRGIQDGDVWGSTDVYGVRLPLPADAMPVILGQVMEREGAYDEDDLFYGMKPTDREIAANNEEGLALNNPMMPVAWVKSYKLPGGEEGRVFTSTIGSSSDLLTEGTRRLLVNGVFWALNIAVPEKANVDLVGNYNPTKYEFRDDQYWEENQLKVEDQK